MKQWKEERCSIRPEALQLITDDIYIQRRNIEELNHEATDEQEAYTEYTCESREITVSEYQMLQSIEEIDTQKAVDDYTMQLMEEGVL
jgi:hypothetical protein